MSPYQPPPDGSYSPHPIESPGGVERRAAPRTRYVHGDVRTGGWLRGSIREALCCPRGHHVKDGALVLNEQLLRCEWKDAPGARHCGLLMWAIVDNKSGATYVAEVDWADVEIIRQHQSVYETLRYVGAPLWPERSVARRR